MLSLVFVTAVAAEPLSRQDSFLLAQLKMLPDVFFPWRSQNQKVDDQRTKRDVFACPPRRRSRRFPMSATSGPPEPLEAEAVKALVEALRLHSADQQVQETTWEDSRHLGFLENPQGSGTFQGMESKLQQANTPGVRQLRPLEAASQRARRSLAPGSAACAGARPPATAEGRWASGRPRCGPRGHRYLGWRPIALGLEEILHHILSCRIPEAFQPLESA